MGRLCSASWRMAHFLPYRPALTEPQASVMGTKLVEHYACRAEGPDRSRRRASWGTSLIGARNLSRCTIYFEGWCACPGAMAITKLSWEQVHLPAACLPVGRAGRKAKSVTNNLPILSVLAFSDFIFAPLMMSVSIF